jgi:Restriction endonuclease
MASVKSGEKGFDLEEALKAYFWQAGYYAVRGILYRLDGEDVTDIDLWLYERPAASTRRRIIVDAKNRKSPKAYERIIWVKGLQAALDVDGAIVATTDTRPSTRRLSKALNVTLLDGDAVAKLTQSEQLKKAGQLRSEDFDGAVKRVDELPLLMLFEPRSDWHANTPTMAEP